MNRRAVLYLRLSAVVEDSTSLARQERDLQDYASRNGLDVVAVLVDEGISGRKAREKATEAVRMLRDNEADVLAVWKLDRFTRQGWNGLGELSAALESRAADATRGRCNPAQFVALLDGLNSDQVAFRLIAGVLSEVAKSEADNAALRVTSSIAHRKTVTNRYAGGSAVPFGYASVPAPNGVGRVLVLNPDEAPIVRALAARIIAGKDPLRLLAAELNARGVATPKSPARTATNKGEDPTGLARGTWRASTIRNLLTGDHLTGRVIHHEDFVRDDDGLPREVWPPVISVETVHSIREALNWTPPKTSRARLNYVPDPLAPAPRKRNARLLSGVAFCFYCNSKLYVTTSSGTAIYRCAAGWNETDCPTPSVNARLLDEFVTAEFLRVIGGTPEMVEVTAPTALATEAKLAEVERALREATAAMMDDDADMQAIAANVKTLKARRAELRTTPVMTAPHMEPTGRTYAEAWAAEPTPDARRALLLMGLDHVELKKAKVQGVKTLDYDRVLFFWVS